MKKEISLLIWNTKGFLVPKNPSEVTKFWEQVGDLLAENKFLEVLEISLELKINSDGKNYSVFEEDILKKVPKAVKITLVDYRIDDKSTDEGAR